MADDTFLKIMDRGIASLLYTKFGTILGLDSEKESIISPKEIAMRLIAEEKGAMKLGFISVWREMTEFDWSRQRTPIARRGIMVAYTNEDKTDILEYKAIPVNLTYSIRFWHREIDKVNEAVEDYLFWQQTDPNLDLLINDEYPLELDLHLGGEIVDESSFPEKFEKGTYFVSRCPLKLDAWIFESDTVKTIHKVVLRLYDEEEEENILLFQRTYDLVTGEVT